MRLLLDTHILLWWLADDAHLGARGRELIANPEHVVFYSAASVWEIRIKAAIGKLDLPDTFADALAAQAFEALSVTAAHAHMLRDLPLLHRDPFDRMLVSQARAEHLTLVTHDEVLTRYDVTSLRV